MQQAATNMKFQVRESTITRISSFKYLGQIITEIDDDLPAVETQIKKARQIWTRISKILKKKEIPTSKLCQHSIKLSFRVCYFMGLNLGYLQNKWLENSIVSTICVPDSLQDDIYN
jgi:hypothetical protein